MVLKPGRRKDPPPVDKPGIVFSVLQKCFQFQQIGLFQLFRQHLLPVLRQYKGHLFTLRSKNDLFHILVTTSVAGMISSILLNHRKCEVPNLILKGVGEDYPGVTVHSGKEPINGAQIGRFREGI